MDAKSVKRKADRDAKEVNANKKHKHVSIVFKLYAQVGEASSRLDIATPIAGPVESCADIMTGEKELGNAFEDGY